MGKFIEDAPFTKNVKEDIFANATLEWLGLSAKQFTA
jgi:hypothetical protein